MECLQNRNTRKLPRVISQHLGAREQIQAGEDNLTGSVRLTEYRVSTDTTQRWINYLMVRSAIFGLSIVFVLRKPQSRDSSVL